MNSPAEATILHGFNRDVELARLLNITANIHYALVASPETDGQPGYLLYSWMVLDVPAAR